MKLSWNIIIYPSSPVCQLQEIIRKIHVVYIYCLLCANMALSASNLPRQQGRYVRNEDKWSQTLQYDDLIDGKCSRYDQMRKNQKTSTWVISAPTPSPLSLSVFVWVLTWVLFHWAALLTAGNGLPFLQWNRPINSDCMSRQRDCCWVTVQHHETKSWSIQWQMSHISPL